MENFLIFLHIPKTAGTTVQHILRSKYGSKYQYGLQDVEADYLPNEATYQALSEEFSDKCALGAHMPYGIHDAISVPYIYLTFLREPLARSVSHYNFMVRRWPHLASKNIIELNKEPRHNLQTRYLAGRAAMLKPKLDETDLQLAKDNLSKNIGLLGIVEKFDESLVYISERLAWKKAPYYLKNNQSKRILKDKTLTFQTLNPNEQDFIREINVYDSLLYEYAINLFSERINEMGSQFHYRVSQFKQFNQLYYYPRVTINKLKSLFRR